MTTVTVHKQAITTLRRFVYPHGVAAYLLGAAALMAVIMAVTVVRAEGRNRDWRPVRVTAVTEARRVAGSPDRLAAFTTADGTQSWTSVRATDAVVVGHRYAGWARDGALSLDDPRASALEMIGTGGLLGASAAVLLGAAVVIVDVIGQTRRAHAVPPGWARS